MFSYYILLKFLFSCGLLALGADRFIVACIAIARHSGLSTLLIGMLLVGFGTSFPELVVSVVAALKGSGHMAIGNAVGSNIANIGLIVGVTALFVPLSVHSQLLKRELPLLLLFSVLLAILLWQGHWGHVDAFILLFLLLAHLSWLIWTGTRQKAATDPMAQEYEKEIPMTLLSLKKAWAWWAIGIILLFIASEWLVDSATVIAQWMKISPFVIGLTVVAVGTSLPELAVTLISALRGEHDIAIGNVVGSNIFNLLAVLMVPAWITPGPVPKGLLVRDYPVMLLFTVALWLLARIPFKGVGIHRLEACLLLLGFIAYFVFLLR